MNTLCMQWLVDNVYAIREAATVNVRNVKTFGSLSHTRTHTHTHTHTHMHTHSLFVASAADDAWYWQKPGSILVQHIATIIMCITVTHCLVSFIQIVYVCRSL